MSTARRIRLIELLSYEVAPDGAIVELSTRADENAEVKLQLPYPMLGSLLMTLPGAMQAAVRQSSGNPKLRHAYHLGAWKLERSSEAEMLLLSMATADGFEVTFSLSEADASSLAAVIRHDVCCEPAPAVSRYH